MSREVKILKSFEYGDESYEEGDVAELSDELASDVIEKGYAMENVGTEEEKPTISPTDTGSDEKNTNTPNQSRKNTGSSKGPVEKWRIPISEHRNLSVTIFNHEEYGLSMFLEEGKKTDDGSWENSRIKLTPAKSFEIAERIKQAGLYVRDNQKGGGGS